MSTLYDFTTTFISGTVAKSAEVNTQFNNLDTAFNNLEPLTNRAIKFPASEGATNQVFTETAAQRQGHVVGFDTAGALTTTGKWLVDWDANSKRLRNLITAVANDEPVTLAQMTAYAASLSGVPDSQKLPAPAPTDEGRALIYASADRRWALHQPNLLFDPNGALGTQFWSSTLTATLNQNGYYWTNAGVLTTQTFDHLPQDAGWVDVGSGVNLVASVTVSTGGTSAGSMSLVVKYYDSGGSLLSTSSGTAIAMATAAEVRYAKAVTTPGSTAKVKIAVAFTGVSASTNGVYLRDAKLELGTLATPFNDANTLMWETSYRAQTDFGKGFVTPIVTTGDATATTSTHDFRSTTGTQAYDARIRSSGGTNGTAGKATLAIEAKTVTTTGPQGYSAEYNAGNTGASITLDFLNGARQKTTMNSATPAITVATSGLVVGHYQIKLIQDGAGSRVPSWVGFAAGDCVGNAFPSIASGANGVTFIYLYWDGAQFWVSGNAWD